MPNGDAAAAAGMDLVGDGEDRRDGWDEINKTRDYIVTIPIDAARITTGTLASARVPNLDASKITTGEMLAARVKTSSGTNLQTLLADLVAADAAATADKVTAAAYIRTSGAVKYAMWMDANRDIVRNTSSRRYKDDIRPADVDVDAVLNLEPVTYHLKSDDDRTLRELGLIAEDSTDVEHLVMWDVARTKDGAPRKGAKPRPEAVRYEQALPVALLAVAKHQAQQIAALTARIEALEARP